MNNSKGSSDWKYRKKPAFKPIMLTSKQIKPIERSRFTEKKISQPKSKFMDVNEQTKYRQSYIAYSNSANRSQIIKKLTEQYRQSLMKKIHHPEDEHHKSIPFATNIIKMEFQPKDQSSLAQTRYQPFLDLDNSQSKAQKRFMYFTNAKTYESFTRPNKIKASKFANLKKQQQKTDDNEEQGWDFLMKNHYLNVTKVFPQKKESSKIQISPEKMEEISRKVQEYHKSLMKKFDEKYRSTTVMISRKNPQKQASFTTEMPIAENNKIQEQILAKRHSPNKRQYFVFGMGDNPNKMNVEALNKLRFQLYKDFLWKINFTNGIYVKIKDQIQSPYKLYVGTGNNSMLIKGIARRRPWWQIVDKVSEDVNFVWTQLKSNQYFNYQNQHEEKKKIFTVKNRKIHSSLDGNSSRKNPKNKNNSQRLQTVELAQADIHQTIMMGEDYQLWMKHYKANKKYEDRFENFMGKRIKTLIRNKNLLYVGNSSQLKVHNHFPSNYYLGNKKALFYSMRRYYQLHDRDPFNFLPTTFHISKGVDDPEYENFLQLYEELNLKKKKKELMNIWILKPGQFTNRGKGINVCSSLDDVKIRLKGKERCKNGKLHTFILQKYIEKPFLYYRRKFDIRHFMLMTCVNGKFKGYWFNEGYIRTSSFQYNIKNCKDLYTHLTNDSIQQNSQDYGKFEKANKLSYGQFQRYLNQQFKRSRNQQHDFYKTILPQMKQIAKDTMQATYMLLSQKRQEHNFQLFGLDFMLDQDLNVYLIEVNTNPCLEISCPLLSKIISSLIENLFKICVDPIFPPPFQWPHQKKFQLGENALEDNKFSIIFDENTDGERLKKLYEKVQLNNGIDNVEEEDEQYEDEGKQWVQD